MLFKRRTDNVGLGPNITATMATSVSRELESLPPDWISQFVEEIPSGIAVFDCELRYIAAKRLAGHKLVAIDATNVQQEARKPLLSLAREYHVLPVAIVLAVPEAVCHGAPGLSRETQGWLGMLGRPLLPVRGCGQIRRRGGGGQRGRARTP